MKEYMKDLVYKENPFLALVPKNESPDGFAGKYIPVECAGTKSPCIGEG